MTPHRFTTYPLLPSAERKPPTIDERREYVTGEREGRTTVNYAPMTRNAETTQEFCDMALAADDLQAFANSMDEAQEAIFRANMERRDQAAADYGEPKSPHEFYAGRPGSRAETIVLDCLRNLQAIPEADRLYVDELTDVISHGFLETSPDGKTEVRRAAALLRASRRKT